MRAKVIVPILGCTGLLLLLAAMLRFGMLAPAPAPPTPDTATVTLSAQTPAPHAVAVSIQPQTDAAALQEQRKVASAQRVAEISEMAATKEGHSLRAILSELSNDDPDVRRAALSAAVDFGDRSAIPALQAAMEANPDPQEKVNLQQAINYLKLPTLTEENLGMETGKTPAIPSSN